jgi:hypothetical protein
MIATEVGCLCVIAFYLALTHRGSSWWARAGLIAAAAWLAEDSCIRLYGFYTYQAASSPTPGPPRGEWHGYLDRVPALIALIWPLVVLSAQALARHLAPGAGARRFALLVGALVVSDAAFIESVAVRAGLWRWSEPGIFGVPVIGILGWGLFAAAVTYCLERLRPGRRWVALLLAPAMTHAALLASWWGALRWVPRPLPDTAAAAVALGVSAVLTARVLRSRGAARRVPASELCARLSAAGLFFVLLVRHGLGSPALVLYAAAFAPPYLALMVIVYRGVRARSRGDSSRAAASRSM